MNKLIITTIALGFSASALAAYDPLINEPGFYPEYLSQNEKAVSTTNTQPGVGSVSDSIEIFDSNHFSYEDANNKNR